MSHNPPAHEGEERGKGEAGVPCPGWVEGEGREGVGVGEAGGREGRDTPD